LAGLGSVIAGNQGAKLSNLAKAANPNISPRRPHVIAFVDYRALPYNYVAGEPGFPFCKQDCSGSN